MTEFLLIAWLFIAAGIAGDDVWVANAESGACVGWYTQPGAEFRAIDCHLPRPIKYDIDGPSDYAIWWDKDGVYLQRCRWDVYYDEVGDVDLKDIVTSYTVWKRK